jgi:hypothetical protein
MTVLLQEDFLISILKFMNKARIIFLTIPSILLIIFFSIFISAGQLINWPLNLPRSLSATLGEIRGSSFHQGIDIKTNARPGYPVFAGGTGNVSRIISKDDGYGNAIFINHDNGIESAYGHLDSFEEGKLRLNSLAKTLKVLYNNDNLDFKLTQGKLHFNKDEKIAVTGESGSGLPHLHFEIRKNNEYLNPLDYIYVKDTNPPVIESIFVCIEKDNATIHERNVKTRKKWGTYTAANSPIDIEGDKIFFKISCYDRAGAYNRVAVYRIKVYEGKEKIFEIAFDSLKNSDFQYGPFVYDISKSTINGGVSYVYVLCRKEGNNFSGINSLRDGYINLNNKEKNQKDISILVSDFAGNEETLHFKITNKNINSPLESNYLKIDRKKSAAFYNTEKNIQIFIPENSVYADTLIGIEDIINPKTLDTLRESYRIPASDLLKIVSLVPNDAIYKKPIKISIKKPPGISEDDVPHVQIYQFFEGRKPRPLKTNYIAAKPEFTAECYTNGFFALIIDKTPPKIFLPPTFELCEDREIFRKIRLYTSDNLSGINKDSILCIIDGETYPSIFDEDRKWIEVSLPRQALAKGIHHIFAKAADTANNETAFRGLLTFE